VTHVTPVPANIPAVKAIELLQGHEFFIKSNPHMITYEEIDPPATNPFPAIPEERGVTAVAAPRCFKVTDRVQALPAGLWDSDAVSTYEFINIERGFFMRIRSPLSIVMESVWQINDKDDGAYEMVEEIVIKCSRLLIGVIKSTCDSGWEGIHAKMMAHLSESLATNGVAA
jgi:hypothetical protein